MGRTGFGSVAKRRRAPSSKPGAVGRVRELRDQDTWAERVMWETLRGRRFLGLKFRRQFPIDGFISDFCCYELRLVVELDGRVHEEPSQAERDRTRGAHIRFLGFTILRFPNEAVLEDMPTVLRKIAEAARLSHRLE